MARYGNSFLNNFSKGGKCVSIPFNKEIIDTAFKSAEALDIPFCGVDLIKKDNYYKDILSIYFIILKLLFCNKRYPFDSEDCIKKYINLSKTIKLNLLMEVINNDKNFKNYIV